MYFHDLRKTEKTIDMHQPSFRHKIDTCNGYKAITSVYYIHLILFSNHYCSRKGHNSWFMPLYWTILPLMMVRRSELIATTFVCPFLIMFFLKWGNCNNGASLKICFFAVINCCCEHHSLVLRSDAWCSQQCFSSKTIHRDNISMSLLADVLFVPTDEI